MSYSMPSGKEGMKVEEDGILMKGRDRKRLHVLRQIQGRRMNQQEAAEVLRITDRQVRRIVKRVRKEGDKGIIHGLRDQHTIYKSNKKLTIEEELEGIEPGQSQFQRAMVELGVEVIHANSPQAKGRIERLFRTLQDRLVKEMRLKGICNCEDANLFLEPFLSEHNGEFAFPAAKRANLHRPIGKGIKLDSILSVKELRRLRNDFTVHFGRKVYQIEESLRTRDVTVEQRTDGSIAITHKGHRLPFHEIAVQPKAEICEEIVLRHRNLPPTPVATHPWRKFRYGRPWKRLPRSSQQPKVSAS